MGFHGKQIQPGTLPLDRLYTTGYIPSAASDLTTVEYVQALNQGLFPKAEARVRAVGDVNLLSPAPVQDGIVMVLGDRMVLGDQVNPIENGIYDYAPTGLVRSADADDPGDLKVGTFVYIQEGATWEGFGFFISGTPTVPPNIDIGVDPILFSTLQQQVSLTVENGLTALGNNVRLGGPLVQDTDVDGGGAYNMTLSNLVSFEISTPAIKFLFDKGGSAMRVENGASTEVFMDLTDDWRFNLAMDDGGGAGSVNASHSVNLAANGTVDDTNSVNAAANTTLALGAKYSFAAGRNHSVGDGVGTHGDSSAAFGIDTLNYGEASITSGVGAQILYVANQRGGIAHGFSTGSGLKPVGVPYVTASSGAVNISRNTVAQTAGFGALAQDSVILGGFDHNIPANSPGSVILGGSGIVARGADPNQVYLPSLNITTALLNDDALTQILVRDPATGLIKYRTAGSLAGATDVENGISIDEGFVVLGGPLVQNTEIDLAEFEFVLTSVDPAALINFELTDTVTTSQFEAMYNQLALRSSDASNSFQVIITPTGGVVTVGGANPGLQYAADYSAYYTNRSLVDKEYVDNAVAGGSFVLTNGNGTTANGTAVDLGGPLTANVAITGAFQFAMSALTNFTLQADIAGGRNARFGFDDGGGYSYLRNDDVGFTQSGQVKVGIDYVQLYASTDPNSTTIEIGPTYFTINGTGSFPGAQYGSDYSANYTNRSLVDKEYVDNAIVAGGVTASNGLTKVVNDIQLGGTLTEAATLVVGDTTSLIFRMTDNIAVPTVQSGFELYQSNAEMRSDSLSGNTGGFIGVNSIGEVTLEAVWSTTDPSTTVVINQSVAVSAVSQTFSNSETASGIDYSTSQTMQSAQFDAFAWNAQSIDSASDNLTQVLTANWSLSNGFQMYRQRYSDIQPDSIYAMLQMNIDEGFMGIYDQSVTGSGAYIGVSNQSVNSNYTPYASVNDNVNNGVMTAFRLRRTATGTGTTNPNAVGIGGRLDYELLIGPVQQVVSGAIDNIATAVGASWETKFTFHVGDTGTLTPVMEIDKYGAKHAADYSANYTNRSLVDKEYVDSAITGGDFWSLTGTSMLLGAATIDGDSSAYGINFDNISNFNVTANVTGITLVATDGGLQLINAAGAGNYTMYHGGSGTFSLVASNTATTWYMGHGGTGDMTFQNTGQGNLSLRNDGNGNYIIENTGVNFNIHNNGTGLLSIQSNGGTGIEVQNNSGAGLSLTNTAGDLSFTSQGDNFILTHEGLGDFKIVDNRGTPVGIEYDADYSANYTVRSLVDKEYVDNAVAGGVTASNGLTEAGGDIKLGGALTADTTISGAFNLNFANSSVTISAAALPSVLNFFDGTVTSSVTHVVGGRLEFNTPIGYIFSQGGTERFRIAAGGDKHVVINLPGDDNAGLVTYSSTAANTASSDFVNVGFVSNILNRVGTLMYSIGSHNVGLAIMPGTASPTANLLSISSNNLTNYDGYMATIAYALTAGAMTANTSKPMLRIIKSVSSDGGFDHTGSFIEMINDTELTGDYIKAWDGTTTHLRIKSNGDQYFSARVIDYDTPFDGLITNYSSASLHYSSVALMKYVGGGDYATGSAIDVDRTYSNVGGQPIIYTIKIEQQMDNDVAINAGAQNLPVHVIASSVDIPTHAGHFEAILTKNNPASTPIAVYAKATITGTGTGYAFYGDGGTLYNLGKIVAGTSSSPAGSLSYTFGDGNVNSGVFGSAMFGELSIIDASVGAALAAGESVWIRAYGGKAFGRGTRVNVDGGFALVGGGWTPGGTDPTTNDKVPQAGGFGAFAFYGSDGSQTDNHGALAAQSAILGGMNHNIPADSPRSVILGGSLIKARAADPDQVYVPNLNIMSIPASGSASDDVLVRDAATGEIKSVTQASIGGGGSIGPPQEDDRDLVPAVTSGDEEPTGLTITNTPTGLIVIALNGEIKSLGNGVKTKHCYFSGDGGTTARAFSAIVATDELYWNGTIAGYDLDTSDVIDFYYI